MSEQSKGHAPPSLCQGSGHLTALHQSSMVGNSETMAALIQGGCAVDLQDRDGNTALHQVSWHGFSQCVKLLVKTGADVHIKNKAGNTALHLACQNAHAETARLLLLGGSTPDTKNNVGDTCLHVAARYNNLTLVKMLLSSLCSVTETNQGGDTALHVAAALNHKKTVQLLLDAGTDCKIRNKAGKTALDKAKDNNHKDVALLLARAPQVEHVLRGSTVRKRRVKLAVKQRIQSVSRVETLPHKVSNLSFEIFHGIPAVVEKTSSRTAVKDLDEDDDFHTKKDLLCDNAEDSSKQNGKTYQLYTLYRDKEGNIKQAPASRCHCKPLLKMLEGQLETMQGEMRLHILNVQEQVNSRLEKMDRKTRHQIKVLDMLNQERVAAERQSMIHMMEQKAAECREEVLMSQAAVKHKLKRWCISHLKDMDGHIPAETQHYKLLPSPLVEQSAAEANPELLPLLSGDSNTSLATYVNTLPSQSAFSMGCPEQEQMGSRTYFEMKVDRSLGMWRNDYENAGLFPLPAKCEEAVSSSSKQSCFSDPRSSQIPHQEHSFSRQHKEHFGTLMNASSHAGIYADSITTHESFTDHPSEPTFSKERNNLHTIEVTQRFFETVSAQLERWCERKILEVEQQTELRAQQDRKKLLERISMLEEELQRLKTN
ncbi:ankyrin repeat domain-containing protein 6 [Acanthochromis polyacanthus]|uniref:ankyrin repeat domain-containing protein 6 n=1 Tax=Acanthochromis polyacanthus TaxID=80966 RepID=UPI0022346C81|nr:ankyrin repeat domain-containing protein 6 [Acanthochromis polyacanthus]